MLAVDETIQTARQMLCSSRLSKCAICPSVSNESLFISLLLGTLKYSNYGQQVENKANYNIDIKLLLQK